MDLRPRLLQTRFLFPFIFEPDNLADAVAELEKLKWTLNGRDVPIWKAHDCLPERYLPEILPHVGSFLGKPSPSLHDAPKPAGKSASGDKSAGKNDKRSNGEGEAAGGDCCRYLKVSNELLDAWFRRGIEVHESVEFPTEDGRKFNAALIHEIGIEAYLSPFGGGIISIALGAEPASPAEDAKTKLMQFNYRLSQYKGKGYLIPWLTLPVSTPDKYKEDYARIDRKDRKELSALSDRLGKAGRAFFLHELVTLLLNLPKDGEAKENEWQMFVPTQNQFSTYTVVQFGSEVDFANAMILAELGPLVAALAQIEEPTHAGHAISGDLDISNAVLNRRHWAAVGYLAATHFVADQQPPLPYNDQRLTTVRDKYFVPYLLAYLQRLGFHSCSARATAFLPNIEGDEERMQEIRKKSTEPEPDPQTNAAGVAGKKMKSVAHRNEIEPPEKLQLELIKFRLAGTFLEVSSREALNRYYRIAQQGLGVGVAQEALGRVIDEFNSMKNARATRQATQTVAHIQNKLELLEVIIVSIYVSELAHFLTDAEEKRHVIYILFFGTAGALFTFYYLDFWKDKKRRWKLLSFIVSVPMVLYFSWAVFLGDKCHWLTQLAVKVGVDLSCP